MKYLLKLAGKISALFPFADLVLLHFPAGAIVSAISLWITPNVPLAVALAACAGVLKEAWDFGRSNKIRLEGFLEFLVTALGGLIVVAIYIYYTTNYVN